jgi:hypothetical protein
MLKSKWIWTTRTILVLIIIHQCIIIKLVTGITKNCSSQVLPKEWFPSFNSNHSLIDYQIPQPLGWGSCFQYSKATCCEKPHVDAIFRMILLMDRAGFSSQCKSYTEKVLCSVACDPDVGLGNIPPIICLDVCNEWYDVCKDEFFSPSHAGIQKIPMPCSDAAVVCSRFGDVYRTGPEFCDAMAIKYGNTHGCLNGEVDPKRRGTPLPSASTGRSSSSTALIDLFLRDIRALSALITRSTDSFKKSIDRFVNKYGLPLKISGVIVFGAILTPVLVNIFTKIRKRSVEAVNDDFR